MKRQFLNAALLATTLTVCPVLARETVDQSGDPESIIALAIVQFSAHAGNRSAPGTLF